MLSSLEDFHEARSSGCFHHPRTRCLATSGSRDRESFSSSSHFGRPTIWSDCGATRDDRLRTWALQVELLRGHNKAAVALANTLTRMPGGCGDTAPTTSKLRPSENATKKGHSSSPGGCYEHNDVRAPRLGPARGEADSDDGHHRPLPSIGSLRATFPHGPERTRSPKRPEIRLQSELGSARVIDRAAPCGGVQIHRYFRQAA
jgi:hypothetical protein